MLERSRKVAGACAAVALATWGAIDAHADSAVLGSAKDNTLYESPTGSLSNGAGDYFFAGRTNASKLRRGLIAFDLSAIPRGATVTSATLTLTLTQAGAGEHWISLHRALADWGEGSSDAPENEGGGAPATAGDATWKHTHFSTQLWSHPGGDLDLTSSAEALVGRTFTSYSWSGAGLTTDVQSWLDGAIPNFGWILLGDESTDGSSKRFASRENPDASIRPVLLVEYTVPAPGAAALLVLSGLVLAVRRPRRSDDGKPTRQRPAAADATAQV